MFLNVSNHPSGKWAIEQLRAAGGTVKDIPFPNVPPTASHEDVAGMVCGILHTICMFATPGEHILVQGEMTLTFALVMALKALGYVPVAATTERVATEIDGVKTSIFQFMQFRAY